jgi:hypothetical protein
VINAAMLGSETQASAQAIYTTIAASEQANLNSYDEACGTSNAYGSTSRSSCTNAHFLCGDGATGTYATCLEAIDCQMHHDMAVSVPSTSTSKFATFARQMIPHHQNAVAMAKVLATFQTDSDYPEQGTEDQDMDWADGLIRDIINVQNFQIQQMQGWLEANAAAVANCYSGVDVVVSFVLSGDVADYDATAISSLKTMIADGAGVASGAVSITITAASVLVTAVIATDDASAASAAASSLSSGIMASASTLSTALASANVDATVQSAPTVGSADDAPAVLDAALVDNTDDTDDEEGGGLSTGALIGIIAGIIVVIVAVALIVVMKKKRKKPIAQKPTDLDQSSGMAA